MHAYVNSNKRSVRADDGELRDLTEYFRCSSYLLHQSSQMNSSFYHRAPFIFQLRLTDSMDPLHICRATISQLVQSQGGAPSISASTMSPCNCPTTRVATFLGLLDLLLLQLRCFAVCELVRESSSTSAKTKPWQTPVLHGRKWDCSSAAITE